MFGTPLQGHSRTSDRWEAVEDADSDVEEEPTSGILVVRIRENLHFGKQHLWSRVLEVVISETDSRPLYSELGSTQRSELAHFKRSPQVAHFFIYSPRAAAAHRTVRGEAPSETSIRRPGAIAHRGNCVRHDSYE